LQEVGAEVLVREHLPIIRRANLNPRGLLELVRSLRSVWWLADLIRRRGLDLVHSATLAVLPMGAAALLARRPQVWHVQEIITSPRVVATLLATFTSMMSTLIIANSQATAEHYRNTRLLTSKPVRVIYYGIDEARLSARSVEAVRPLTSAGEGDVVFTLPGRINRWKGHSVFLDAAERLAAEREDVRFLVVGDSFTGQEHMTEAVDRRIRDSEHLRRKTVRVPHIPEIGSVYEASDVVVVPSTEPEPFGLVCTEAMAMGLPVIASRLGGLQEQVEEGVSGFLVDAGDADSLLAAMRRLADASAEERTGMGRRGRESFERHFRLARYAEEFSRVYEELLRDVRDPGRGRAGPLV
jgi:glycosyltransferase involved in cell wall biosynthesis